MKHSPKQMPKARAGAGVWDADVLRATSEDDEFLAAQTKGHTERAVGRACAEYQGKLDEHAEAGPVDRERLANLTDFDYRFRYRHLLPRWLRDRLELIAAKLAWKTEKGSPGYFAGLAEHGIDWKSHASVIASIRGRWADRVIKCGIWTKGSSRKKRNSGRCKQYDACPLCIWIDFLKLLEEAFGPGSGTFGRAQNSFAIHLSIRDSKRNSRAIGRGLRPEDYDLLNDNGLYSEVYEARPVPLEADLDLTGIPTCRLVFLAAQEALDALYKRGILAGYRQKLEVALLLQPTRGLPHAHAVANGPEDNPQFIAEELYTEMNRVLKRHRLELVGPLYPSVRVYAIPTSDDLWKCVKYLEKPIPLGLLVREALSRAEAKNSDGTWNLAFMHRLEHGLLNLPEQLRRLSGGFRAADLEFYWLQRRRSMGNMRFGKNFIGYEPEWHENKRKRCSRLQAMRRAEKKRMSESQ